MGRINESTYREFDSDELNNLEHDKSLRVKKVMPYGQSGTSAIGFQADPFGNQKIAPPPRAVKITEAGSLTYIGFAAPGTAENEARWQAFLIDQTTGMRLTWADGDSNYDNVVTDLTALTYT